MEFHSRGKPEAVRASLRNIIMNAFASFQSDHQMDQIIVRQESKIKLTSCLSAVHLKNEGVTIFRKEWSFADTIDWKAGGGADRWHDSKSSEMKSSTLGNSDHVRA